VFSEVEGNPTLQHFTSKFEKDKDDNLKVKRSVCEELKQEGESENGRREKKFRILCKDA